VTNPYPAGPNNLYIPSGEAKPPPPTIEYVREHGVVVVGDGETGLAEVKCGLVVSYCRVTLNPDGSIKDFAPCRINKYVRITPEKS
jgi:hypothetical protein